MANNRFGSLFAFTTWGESHGKAVGVVIDGCPAGLALDEDLINRDLARRAPGSSPYVSPRRETDRASILSGLFEGKTTGTPISLIIDNGDVDSSKYAPIADLLRPGHASFTYLAKYGLFDWRGGGRASARETACRVAAGAVARQLLAHYGVSVRAWLGAVGSSVAAELSPSESRFDEAMMHVQASPLFAPDAAAQAAFAAELDKAVAEGDSVGGVVNFAATGLPAGLGDPVYGKLDALLAAAMLSIPASKGFEIGQGFSAATQRGSAFTEGFTTINGMAVPAGNKAGGLLGGISTGLPVYGRVAFKPTASFFQPLPTVDSQGQAAEFLLPQGSRHDSCVAIRAVPVVEAMGMVVLADALLLHRASTL